jgi:hypothetical protein
MGDGEEKRAERATFRVVLARCSPESDECVLHNIFSQCLISQDPQCDRLDGTTKVLEQLRKGIAISRCDARSEFRVTSIQLVQVLLRSAYDTR